MRRIRRPSAETIHALYPELKELWMLVYEANCLERRLMRMRKTRFLGLGIIDNGRIDRLKEKNFDRYDRRLEMYLTTKKMMGIEDEIFYAGGQAI